MEMTHKTYAKYLGELINEDINIDSDYLEDQFYGYFQCFMPYGENIDKVFEPIPNGQALFERIKPIFKATEAEVLKAFEQNTSLGYFVLNKKGEEAEIKEIGKQILQGFTDFAVFMEDETLQQYIEEVTEIEIVEEEDQDFNNDRYVYLYEAFLDWCIDNTDYESPFSILREAYYSINCDYFLAAYFQYPNFNNKPSTDFLKSYYKLWERGYKFVINDKKLVLF